MGMDIIPTWDLQRLPDEELSFVEGRTQGVHLTMNPDHLDWILNKIQAWFDGCDEVVLIGYGVTRKTVTGFVILEWEGYEINPLFLKILENEELIEDYGVYGDEEDDDADIA